MQHPGPWGRLIGGCRLPGGVGAAIAIGIDDDPVEGAVTIGVDDQFPALRGGSDPHVGAGVTVEIVGVVRLPW